MHCGRGGRGLGQGVPLEEDYFQNLFSHFFSLLDLCSLQLIIHQLLYH